MRRLATIGTCSLALAMTLSGGSTAGVREYGVDPGQARPRPACPREPPDCQALGKVTGVQLVHARRRGSKKYPYRAVRDGRLVGFSVTLSKPTRRQRQYFSRTFGGTPRVRVAVLKPDRRGTGSGIYRRLIAQSGVHRVSRYLGSKPTFALARPIRVRKGWEIGLTVPTWSPSLAIGSRTRPLSTKETWRASRPKGTCRNVTRPASHQKPGSVKPYACLYRTARITYTAIVISDNRPTS